jgi:hypothetical protein
MFRNYYIRIAVAALLLFAIIGVLFWRGRPTDEIVFVDVSPIGRASTDASISIRFSRPVDRQSAEQHFFMFPLVAGTFQWDDTTLFFYPTEALAPGTIYRVYIRRGLRDTSGYVNRSGIEWSFRTIDS